MSRRMATKRDTNHAAISLRSATKDSKTPDNYTYTHKRIQRSFRAPLQCGNQKHENGRPATAAQTRYLSSPPAATLHGKTQGFVLRLPPQPKSHATFMQPLQCVLEHHVSNLHVSTHMATKRDTNHAAIPVRSATTSKTPYNYTHTNASKAASSHRCSAGTKKHHTGRPATAAHTRATFPRRLQPLFTEKPKVSYSGFLSNPSPMQHSCSHYIAFCIITCLTRMSRRMATKRDTNHAAISLRSATTDSKTPDNYTYTHTHKRIQRSFRAPLQCGNQKHRKRAYPQPPHTHELPLHRRLQPLYTEKRKVSCSGFQPKPHATSMQPLQCVLQHHVSNWHQSCSHVTEICSHRLQNTLKNPNKQMHPKQLQNSPSWMHCYVI